MGVRSPWTISSPQNRQCWMHPCTHSRLGQTLRRIEALHYACTKGGDRSLLVPQKTLPPPEGWQGHSITKEWLLRVEEIGEGLRVRRSHASHVIPARRNIQAGIRTEGDDSRRVFIREDVPQSADKLVLGRGCLSQPRRTVFLGALRVPDRPGQLRPPPAQRFLLGIAHKCQNLGVARARPPTT